jgi:hypothetical protein
LKLSLTIGVLLMLIECTPHREPPASAGTYRRFGGPYPERIGLGMACRNEGATGPAGYSVHDMGKPRVPKLDAQDRAMLRSIMRFVHLTTLRFAYAPNFIVYDADDGPCSGHPYAVLNLPGCNAMYWPLNTRHGQFPAMGCYSHPRPWIHHDLGNPSAPSWSRYDNSH